MNDESALEGQKTMGATVGVAGGEAVQANGLNSAEAAKQIADANREARALAVWLHRRFYHEVTQWRPFDEAAMILSQIDNMIAGVVERLEAAEARASALTEAIAPFAAFAVDNTAPGEEDGRYGVWSGVRCERDRIVDWFGPTDFLRAAQTALADGAPAARPLADASQVPGSIE